MPSHTTAKAVAFALCCLLLAQITQAQSISTTFAAQTGNNTAACSGQNDPLGNHPYCTGNLAGFPTNSGNSNAETQRVDAIPGHMSHLSLTAYLVSNGTTSGPVTKFIAPYQPWFCTSGGGGGPFNGTQTCDLTNAGNHKVVGYDENSLSVIAAQHDQMIRLGYWAVSPDWYGTANERSFQNATVQTQAADLAARANHPLKLLLMLDGGALLYDAQSPRFSSHCPESGDQTTCITNHIEDDLDYIDLNWAESSYYARDSSGANLVSVFINECNWPSVNCTNNPGPTNWDTIWQNVALHVGSYTTAMKFIKEFGDFNSNNDPNPNPFTTTYFSGAYAWPQPRPYTNSGTGGYTFAAIPSVPGDCSHAANGCMQFYWDQTAPPPGSSYEYLGDFYTQATGNYSDKIAFAELFKGFDWSNAAWQTGPKIVAEQCGQVLTYAADKLNAYYQSNPPAYVQTPTWNDYEEGTELETGVDNCYRVQNAAYNSSQDQLTWQLNPVSSQQSHVSINTVYAYTVWAKAPGTSGVLHSIINVPAAATSLDNVSGLVGSGSWTLYVEMVGMPLIINQMSNGANYP